MRRRSRGLGLRSVDRDIRETDYAQPPLCVTGWGLPLDVLPLPESMAESETFIPPDADERFRRHPVAAMWLSEYDWNYAPFDAEKRGAYLTWRDIPSRILEQVFTAEELRRLWWNGSPCSSNLSDRFERDPLLHPQWTIKNSMWQYGWSLPDEYVRDEKGDYQRVLDDHFAEVRRYNLFARFCAGIRRFHFGDGFVSYLNHVSFTGEYGWAKWGRGEGRSPVYLDGKMGFSVLKDGKHVLTIGFSPSSCGLFVAQVQLRQKKGNRWLFKLPSPLLDYVLERLRVAFDLPVWLVTGESAARAVASSYDEGQGPSAETLAHIRGFYGPPRSAVCEKRLGREFALAC